MQYNDELRQQIVYIESRKALLETARLSRRHTSLGSLEQTVREYYRLFHRGFRPPPHCGRCGNVCGCSVRTRHPGHTQRLFVLRTVDQDAHIGDQLGPEALLQQWQLYIIAHAGFEGVINRIEVVGTEQDPMVIVRSRVYTVIAQSTIALLFPHLITDPAMQRKLLAREVVYDSVTWFQFTDVGRIKSKQLELDMIGGLQRAGLVLQDVERILQLTTVTSTGTIVPLSYNRCM